MKSQQLETLAAVHPAFFVCDTAGFGAALQRFAAAFAARYPRAQGAYSVKTNYLPALCDQAWRAGWRLEVVSAAEFALARALGVPGAEIVVNGPYKTPEFLWTALDAGALVNLDAEYELAPLADYCARHPARTIGIGLRCNPALPGQPVSRFGFRDLTAPLTLIRRAPNLRLTALHVHVCTPRRQAADYRALVLGLLELIDRHDLASDLEVLDLGGGFVSAMPPELAAQFDFPLPTLDDYAAALGDPLRARFGDRGPTLLLEPGLAVVADCLTFFARVIDIKTIDGTTFVLLAGSQFDIKPTRHGKRLPCAVALAAATPRVAVRKARLVGHTCLEDDCLHPDFTGTLGVGDLLAFGHVGAYTLVLRPPFIAPAAPVFALDPDGAPRLLRPAQPWESLFGAGAFEFQPPRPQMDD